jgi:lantibiotic biosynthesis protein
LAAVHDVIRDLAGYTTRADSAGAPYVDLNLATFYSFVTRAEICDCTDAARDVLDRGLNAITTVEISDRLVGGLAGIGWMLELIVGQDADVINRMIDDKIAATLAVETWSRDLDLLRGLVGFGTYALTRLPAEAARPMAVRCLDHLESLAERSDAGLRWFNPADVLIGPVRERYPDGCYDLGLAHGQAGIIGLLARYVAHGIDVERATRLLEACVGDLLSRSRPPIGRFGGTQLRGSDTVTQAPMAWCYGDPGVVLALLAAARALGRADWEAEALDVAREMTTREAFAAKHVSDASICHGAAGLAHLFRILHRAYPDDRFASAASTWLRKTLELRHHGKGYGGFRSIDHEGGQISWFDSAIILSGAVGPALVLLDAATDCGSEWDEMFLFGIDRIPRRVTE